MMKMLIEFDEEKVKAEGKYDINKMWNILDTEFEKRGITKDENGIYVNGTFETFGGMILGLEKLEWFMHNLKSWIWYDYNVPADFGHECSEEDLLSVRKEKGMVP